jgi:hypothetical protein
MIKNTSPVMRRLIPFAPLILAGLIMLSIHSAPPAAVIAAPRPRAATQYTFSGHVFEGAAGDRGHPPAGVEVALYASPHPYPDLGDLVDRTDTASDGSYSLIINDLDSYEFFHIREWNDPGYVSVWAN